MGVYELFSDDFVIFQRLIITLNPESVSCSRGLVLKQKP